jgi:hypothetical protein
MGECFTSGSFLKIPEAAQNLWLLFPAVKVVHKF